MSFRNMVTYNAIRGAIKFLSPFIALIFSFLIGGVIILLIGKNPAEIYGRLFSETLGNWYGIGQVLFKSTTFIFTGLSAAIAFRTGLFNVGGEGQLTIGAFAMGLIGYASIDLPPAMHILLCACAGMIFGALWGVIPGFLKARYGAHEVITTIMMNFIAAALVSYFVNNVIGIAATIHTPPIHESAQLSRLESIFNQLHGSPVNLSFLLSLVMCLVIYHIIARTRTGYELRTTGLNKDAAEYAHIDIQSRVVVAMAMAGGIAGLGGSNFVMGYKHYFEIGFTDNAGFIGIAVALLGRNHPFGIILASLFLGMLEYGGLTINTLVPKELVTILQATLILCTIIMTKVIYSVVYKLQKKMAIDASYA